MIRATAGWVRWHSPELFMAVTPTTLAVTVHPAWAVVTAGVVGRWWWQEHRTPRPDPSPPPEGGQRHERDEARDEASA